MRALILGVLLPVCVSPQYPNQFEILERQITIAVDQQRVQASLDAYWREFFYVQDYNRFVKLMNEYRQRRQEGKVDLKLLRQAREAFDKIAPGGDKRCEP